MTDADVRKAIQQSRLTDAAESYNNGKLDGESEVLDVVLPMLRAMVFYTCQRGEDTPENIPYRLAESLLAFYEPRL